MVYIHPQQEKRLAEVDVKTKVKSSIATTLLAGIIVASTAAAIGAITAAARIFLGK